MVVVVGGGGGGSGQWWSLSMSVLQWSSLPHSILLCLFSHRCHSHRALMWGGLDEGAPLCIPSLHDLRDSLTDLASTTTLCLISTGKQDYYEFLGMFGDDDFGADGSPVNKYKNFRGMDDSTFDITHCCVEPAG